MAPSTVSLVLTGKGDALGIAPETQRRVREAARELGYVPNQLIRAVKEGRSRVIGLYLRWEQWSRPCGYWPEMVWHLQNALAPTDHQFLVYNAPRDCPTEEIYARQAGGMVDGVLLLNSGNDALAERLEAARLPAVEVGDIHSDLPYVGSDGAVGVGLALEHLHARGYRRPAYLAHASTFAKDQQSRAEAFRQVGGRLWGTDLSDRVRFISVVAEALPEIVDFIGASDCVLCSSDETAHELFAWARRSGLRVPEDLAIVGFDALTTLGNYPLLTSIATPMRRVAELAVQKLLAVIEGRPFEQETVLIPTLRLGETT